MRIAVYLRREYNPSEGGGFSYFDRLVQEIDSFQFDESLEICFITEGECSQLNMKRPVVSLCYNPTVSFFERIKCHLPGLKKRVKKNISKRHKYERDRTYLNILEQERIRLIYYPNQTECILPDFPFIATNWDIGHRSTFPFPELITNGVYENRCHFYDTILPRALMVFCESKAGKQELLHFTNINEDKIKVVPMFAGRCVQVSVSNEDQQTILHKYNLQSQRFFYYPAQFWAHKNHFNVLCAFKSFKIKHPEYQLVFTGSNQGNWDYIKQTVSELDLDDSVVFGGFVSIETVNTLYNNATSMLMASFFGPTNMPPIEAMEIGCPIICTDLAGHREELGDAAIYFDATNIEELTNAMETMIIHRDEYIVRLNEQKVKSRFTIDNALISINRYFMEASIIRNTWA